MGIKNYWPAICIIMLFAVNAAYAEKNKDPNCSSSAKDSPSVISTRIPPPPPGYWTRERMKNAKPLPMERSGPLSGIKKLQKTKPSESLKGESGSLPTDHNN